MVAPAACSNWLLLSSFFAVGVEGFVLPPANSHGTSVAPGWNFAKDPSKASSCPLFMVLRDAPPPSDFSVVDNDGNKDDDAVSTPTSKAEPTKMEEAPKGEEKPSIKKTTKKSSDNDDKSKSKRNKYAKYSKKGPNMEGTSWLQKNAAFNDEDIEDGSTTKSNDPAKRSNRSFRQDFRGTRVFVQGIPSQVSWQDLKDHFAIAGTVIFASVSVDAATGESKGVGLVQFETSDMAVNAISVMRNHPLNGSALYVREDVQEQRSGGSQLRNPPSSFGSKRDTPPSRWECADDENSAVLSLDEKEGVISLIKARDAARRRKNYEASDQMRNELKSKFGVHVDDRLKQWWVSFDGSHVPQTIRAVKGDGRWGGKQAWRQIPTTPENDACVNPDLVNGLLVQRDIARMEKDFTTADSLLEEARNSPDGDLDLRIHDDSRTWRIWTDAPPPRAVRHSDPQKSPAELCIELVREKAPHKEDEIRSLLEKFPGREYPILKKLRKSLEDL